MRIKISEGAAEFERFAPRAFDNCIGNGER
jgi:hypothetical protein